MTSADSEEGSSGVWHFVAASHGSSLAFLEVELTLLHFQVSARPVWTHWWPAFCRCPAGVGGLRSNSLRGCFQSRCSLSSCRLVCRVVVVRVCEAVCWCARVVVDNESCFFVKYSPPNNHCVLESCAQHSGPQRKNRNHFISCSCICFKSYECSWSNENSWA